MGGQEVRVSELPVADWQALVEYSHPADRPLPPWFRRYYGTLAAVMREQQPRTVVELGVRAGYSAFITLRTLPACTVYGIDGDLDEERENTHGGRLGLFRHAVLRLPPDRFRFERCRTESIGRLPPCDLVYVDADHTYEGVARDLLLASNAAPAILLDDYDSSPGVRQAVDEFAYCQDGWRSGYYGDDGESIPGFILLVRR